MMLSICITVKNRSRVEVGSETLYLFPNCIRSITESISPDVPCEIVVTDWGSNDWPLEDWLRAYANPIPVQIIHLEGSFSRGKGLNEAARVAKGNYLFFADADLLLSPELIDKGIQSLKGNKAFFPVVYSFEGHEHQMGWWRYEGFGNCMITKDMFYQVNGWPEFKIWGKEDDDFYSKIKLVAEVVREEVPFFYHQWHPDDLIWKNRYAENAAGIANEIKQVEIAKREIIETIPEGEGVILIDEGRFGGSDCIPGRIEYQFPELNGEYGGPPPDGEAAIKEFERFILKGAKYLVIAWMSFWWLEYYESFNDYVLKHCNVILDNERLRIMILKNTS